MRPFLFSVPMIETLYSHFLNSTGVCTDTRSLVEGNLFIALKGPSFNANDFVLKAIQNGAEACIADEHRPEFEGVERIYIVEDGLEALQDLATYHRKKLKIPIVALTGSNGKTTTKELIHAALSKQYRVYATRGNFNNHIGVPLSILEIDRSKHEIAIIEMGANHQKEIAALSEIARPDFGAITNIGLAHLEGFGGEEGVYKGKKELFDYISENGGKVFVNADDHKVVKAATGIESFFFGSDQSNHISGDITSTSGFLELEWIKSTEEVKQSIRTNLTGEYNFSNVLMAICVATYFGVSPDDIKGGIEDYHPDNNRSQIESTNKKNDVILDCYNANPSSMSAAIINLDHYPSSKIKIAILGDMLELGDRSSQEHQQVVDQLRTLNIEKTYLVGPEFGKSQWSNIGAMHFETTEDLGKHLKDESVEESVILLKASRKMKLEQLFELL